MNLHTTLRNVLKDSSKEHIAKQLAYNSTSKALNTLNEFIEHKDLHSWISNGHYDFKYTAIGFVKKLGEVLAISDEDLQLALYEQKVYQNELDRFQNCYIFVETYFRRTGQPIFVLACLSSHRTFGLSIEQVLFKTDEEVLDIASKSIIEHYKRTEGKLPVFGDIHHYQYHHTDNKIYTFGGDGQEIKCEITKESQATLTIGGKKLC